MEEGSTRIIVVRATSSRDGTKWQGAELAGSLVRLFTEHSAYCVLNACPDVLRRGSAVKPVGEPDSGNRDLRFDERCALQVRTTQPPEVAVAVKPSEQPRTESCVVGR